MGDFQSSCGSMCRDMQQYMGSPKIAVTYGLSKTDHTQFILFSVNQTVNVGGGTNAKNFMGFRGTVFFDIINFRRNFVIKFAPTTMCSGCHVHQGFWRNFLALRPSAMGALKDYNGIVFAGISMGAPVATLAGMQALKGGKSVLGVVTSGMPRFTDSSTANYVLAELTGGVKTVGFAYARDPVPHAPPRFFGYTSAQSKIFHIIVDRSLAEDIAGGDIINTKYDEPDIGDFVYYSKVYENDENDFSGDKMFASDVSSYTFSDHAAYFSNREIHGCGFDVSESMVHMSNAAELFFM